MATNVTRRLITFGIAAYVAVLLVIGPVYAQVLQDKWIRSGQKDIDQHRKVPLHVLVLDEAGRPAPLANLRIRMLRHSFAFGVELDPQQFAADRWPGPEAMEQPIWRCLSAVSLRRAGDWSSIEPTRGDREFERIDAMLTWAAVHGMRARWGGVIGCDPGKLPPWAASMRGFSFQQALEAQSTAVLTRFGRRVSDFDLLTDALTYDVVADRLGDVMVRRLYQQAQADAPTARLCVGFNDCLESDRLRAMIRRVNQLRQNFVPVGALAIEVSFHDAVQQGQLDAALRLMV